MHPLGDTLLHAQHELVEVRLGCHELLVPRICLHLPENAFVLFGILGGRFFPPLGCTLEACRQLLETLEPQLEFGSALHRALSPREGLAFLSLPDEPPEIHRLFQKH